MTSETVRVRQLNPGKGDSTGSAGSPQIREASGRPQVDPKRAPGRVGSHLHLAGRREEAKSGRNEPSRRARPGSPPVRSAPPSSAARLSPRHGPNRLGTVGWARSGSTRVRSVPPSSGGQPRPSRRGPTWVDPVGWGSAPGSIGSASAFVQPALPRSSRSWWHTPARQGGRQHSTARSRAMGESEVREMRAAPPGRPVGRPLGRREDRTGEHRGVVRHRRRDLLGIRCRSIVRRAYAPPERPDRTCCP